MFGRPKAKALKASGADSGTASKKAGSAKLTRKERAEARARLPNPVPNLVLADLVLRGGGELLRRAVEKSLLTPKIGKTGADQRIKARSMGETLITSALARVATRSVPGAIVVGGGMIAKSLYDRRKAKAKAKKDKSADD